MRSMTFAEASARRLERNHLTDATRTDDPARIAADVLGVHAQVMSAAELSIGVRSETLTRTGVRTALWTDRTLVKTRGPRGTVHLLATADLPMWTGALSAVPGARSPFPPEARMTAEQTEQVVAAIGDAVVDAELTVDELTDAIVARVGAWAGDRVMEAFQDKWPRWRQAESIATNRGVMCFGPDRGRRATYASPRRWLPGFRPAPAKEALAALVRRYLDAYGPATPQHFARWLGAPPDWAAELFARQDDLEEVDVDGARVWIARGAGEAAVGESVVRLLPYFDAYLIGCHPRAKLFPGRAAERALTGGQAGNVPALLVDGLVAGVWHQRRSGRKVAVTVEPLIRLSARQREGLTAQAVRIGLILEGTATLTVGPVTVGAHA
ncbi:MAG TPA: winged helix DNA-binding domain-containing protein [Actinoplanes sp.]|nr:winged helix DNA-binding domain-containing protein [Actinoplanes sp.]